MSLSWARIIQTISWIHILVLSFPICLSLISSVFPTQPCMHLSSPSWCYNHCSSHHSNPDSRCYPVLFRPKYFPEHPILRHPQSMSPNLPQCERPISHPYKKTDKIKILRTLIFVFLNRKQETTIFCTEL